ncbi:hypothetical protein M427DRAFT_130148 [Gonapodya prolifera JEL478]|uniref:Xylanolytic transcriptional activator regulatory domain-containing protein n=1 Tax=Gonapodya prolifera (strain JEL478) TaxID=1344416 RepID=A0A139B0H4_GONPJ|nr:hypothetical protein M427DRAFT_130148 [Gonapodya prolifera JEL478]|eukprot:KXS22474.1 hypothetical protein M427DRAFT_130148 [Gonapodya prolifera JEL478]
MDSDMISKGLEVLGLDKEQVMARVSKKRKSRTGSVASSSSGTTPSLSVPSSAHTPDASTTTTQSGQGQGPGQRKPRRDKGVIGRLARLESLLLGGLSRDTTTQTQDTTTARGMSLSPSLSPAEITLPLPAPSRDTPVPHTAQQSQPQSQTSTSFIRRPSPPRLSHSASSSERSLSVHSAFSTHSSPFLPPQSPSFPSTSSVLFDTSDISVLSLRVVDADPGTSSSSALFDTTHWDAGTPMPDLPSFDASAWHISRTLTAFDDLPPVPPPTILNSLVLLYFDRFPLHFSLMHFSLVHRSAFLSSSSPPDPIVIYAILTIASHMHESPEVRAMGRGVFFPRLRRAIRAGADRPGVPGLVGLLYGFSFAVKHVMWKEAYFYYIQAVSHIKLLNLVTERALAERLPSWTDRESYRRCFWFTYICDRSIAAATNRPVALQDVETCGIMLPCPDEIWDSAYPPASYIPPHTLDSFFSIRTTATTPDPTAISQFAFESALCYPFGHVVEFHQHWWNRGVMPFAPGSERQKASVLARMGEIEEELETWKRKLDDYVTAGGKGLSEKSVRRLKLSYHGVWTVLHGPSTLTLKLATEFVLRPVWIAASPNPGAAYRVGNFDRAELERTLVAWSQSPSFLSAFAHAAEASEIAKEEENHLTEVGTDTSHDTTTVLLCPVVIIFLATGALQTVLDGPAPDGLVERAHTVLAELHRMCKAALGHTKADKLLLRLADEIGRMDVGGTTAAVGGGGAGAVGVVGGAIAG